MNIGQKRRATIVNEQRIEKMSTTIMLKMNIRQRRGIVL
jgi:hypothetical protein